MKSIRVRLATSLFCGFIVLLTAASTLVFFVARKSLANDFDSRLFARSQAALASISQQADKIDIDWNDLPQEINPQRKHTDMFQVYDSNGTSIGGDNNLNTPVIATLVQATPRQPLDVARYENVVLPNQHRYRVLTISFLPYVEADDADVTPAAIRRNCLLVMATDRHELDRSLQKLTVVLVATTVITSLLSLVVVWLSLKRELRPLDRLGAAVVKVQASSLGNKLSLEGLPEELTPIAEKLNDLLSRLEISFARERRFSSDVSHELRTPVAELKTLSEVMLQEPNDAKTHQAFQDTLAIADHMGSLIAILLEMVRQEDQSAPLTMSEIEIGPAIQAAWKRFSARAGQKGISLKFTWPEKDLVIRSEPRLLGMVLANLLDNAVEYAPNGTAIEVELRGQNGASSLVIGNEAPQLTAADLPHLFERFWRKDRSRTESGHFGIGLALTRTICRRLGIDLTVSMDQGNVVRFWLQLPADITPAERREPEAATAVSA